MSGHGEKMSKKREEFIAAMLTESTFRDVGLKIGIDERTARRWYRDPEIQSEIIARRSEIIDQTMAKLIDKLGDAVDTLSQNLGATQDSVQVAAARAIITFALKAREDAHVLSRLDELERQFKEQLPHAIDSQTTH